MECEFSSWCLAHLGEVLEISLVVNEAVIAAKQVDPDLFSLFLNICMKHWCGVTV